MEEPSPEPRPKPRRQWIFSIPSCALKSCTFAAAARHGESKTSGRTLLVSAIVQSVSTKSCALKSCTFAAAARHGESKTMPCASGGTSSQGLPCGQPLSVSGGQEHRTPGGAANCGMHTTRIAPPGFEGRKGWVLSVDTRSAPRLVCRIHMLLFDIQVLYSFYLGIY